jgi:hypothetical protein
MEFDPVVRPLGITPKNASTNEVETLKGGVVGLKMGFCPFLAHFVSIFRA